MFLIDCKYVEDLSDGLYVIKHPYVLSSDPLTIKFPFLIKDSKKIYEEAQKLGLDINKYKIMTHNNGSLISKFIENPPQILWKGKIIIVPPNSKQLCLCRVAFRRLSGESISWDEVAEEIDGQQIKKLETTEQAIYDAMRALNRKVKQETQGNLFQWDQHSFHRIN